MLLRNRNGSDFRQSPVSVHPLESITMWIALALACLMIWIHAIIPHIIIPIWHLLAGVF